MISFFHIQLMQYADPSHAQADTAGLNNCDSAAVECTYLDYMFHEWAKMNQERQILK